MVQRRHRAAASTGLRRGRDLTQFTNVLGLVELCLVELGLLNWNCRTSIVELGTGNTKLSERSATQVLCSAMVFREDIDVGSWTLGDLHTKSRCVQLRVEEVLQSLHQFRATQLRLFNCGIGLEEATDDIAPDVHCTRALLGKEVVMPVEKPETAMGFVAEVNEAMTLDTLDAIPMHCDFEGVEGISTQDLSLTQLSKDLQNTTDRFTSRPTH